MHFKECDLVKFSAVGLAAIREYAYMKHFWTKYDETTVARVVSLNHDMPSVCVAVNGEVSWWRPEHLEKQTDDYSKALALLEG